MGSDRLSWLAEGSIRLLESGGYETTGVYDCASKDRCKLYDVNEPECHGANPGRNCKITSCITNVVFADMLEKQLLVDVSEIPLEVAG